MWGWGSQVSAVSVREQVGVGVCGDRLGAREDVCEYRLEDWATHGGWWFVVIDEGKIDHPPPPLSSGGLGKE